MLFEIDGTILEGEAAEIVAEMHRGAFLKEPDDAHYMKAVAHRVYLLHGIVISSTDPERFLIGLAAVHPNMEILAGHN